MYFSTFPGEPLRGMGRSTFWFDAPCRHSHHRVDSPCPSGDITDRSWWLACEGRINQESLHELHEAQKKAGTEEEMIEDNLGEGHLHRETEKVIDDHTDVGLDARYLDMITD